MSPEAEDARDGDIVALYNHWLDTAKVKGLDDPHREALWHVVVEIHAALDNRKTEAEQAWVRAFSKQGAVFIRRAVSEAAARKATGESQA